MNLFFWKQKNSSEIIYLPKLFDEDNFYTAFVKDLLHAKKEVIIESPFITSRRVNILFPIFEAISRKGIKIYIVTRAPEEHDDNMRLQAEHAIVKLENIGISILFCDGNHHRKLAILDRSILWDGSLNILSQRESREIMKRTEREEEAKQMFYFLNLDSVI